jgi:uncharacterized protein YjiS (DUF1127 family)
MAANATHASAVALRFSSYGSFARLSRSLSTLCSIPIRWIRDSVTRRRLEDLDDHLLRDIGFDPLAVRQEIAQPFWQPIELKQSRD